MKYTRKLCFIVIITFFVLTIILDMKNEITFTNMTIINEYLSIELSKLEEVNLQLNKNNENNKSIEYLCNDVVFMQELIEPIKELDKQEYLINYNKIMNKYSEILDSPETIYDQYTEEEIMFMWKCIETETYQASFDAKVNVASVILNRIESNDFPNNPIDVITAKNQFVYGRDVITESTKMSLEYAFTVGDTVDNCIAFRSPSSLDSPKYWNGWKLKMGDGYHSFYKIKED